MSELALQLIAENKKTQDPFLDLGNCGLEYYLPVELGDCIWLKSVNLGYLYYNEANEWTGTKNRGFDNFFHGDEFILLENLPNLEELYLYGNRINDISFLSNLYSLIKLDLTDNQIKDIDFLVNLSNLSILNLGENQILGISPLVILPNLSSLDLHSNEITNISFLTQFSKLTQLDLSDNDIFDYGVLNRLTNLSRLELRSNNISDFSFLSGLSNLLNLDLNDNQIIDINFLDGLSNLVEIYLGSNQINDYKILASFSNLSKLDLSSNKLSYFSLISGFSNLIELDLSHNQIKEIDILSRPSKLSILDLSFNNILDIGFLSNLSNLSKLDISRNQITEFSCLSRLGNLSELELRSNKINDISFLSGLYHLSKLNLSDNKIKDISILSEMSNLSQLDIHYNPINNHSYLLGLSNLTELNLRFNQITDLEILLPLLKRGLEINLEDNYLFELKNEISLKDNPIINPPYEILKQGREAVIEYFEKITKEGTDYIYEAKLTLVGDGASGKTSLQTRIMDKAAPLPKREERTRGIKISNWYFKDKEEKEYTANIWDFGGQDVYYPVHRFFLTENSVYVLMASTRIQSHNFEYWIPTIYQFGGNSPIILVQNCHDNNRAHWNDLGIFYGNPNFKIIKPHFELNLPNQNEGLSILENAIEQQIIQLPHIGKPVPKSWVKVRAVLAERQKVDACISYEKFIEICQIVDSKNFEKTNDVKILGRFFADLGIILWYHDKEYLKDWIILQPQWAMLAVYKIIDDIEVQKNGIINRNDFKRLWCEEEFIQKHELLKSMIQVFKIAFPKKHTKEDFILPARLNSLPDEKRWTNIDKTIRLEYTFDFMPRGIVNQISAELSRQIKSNADVWNNAVNFKLNASEAQVEEDYFKRNIYIKANGQDARGLVILIIEAIENTLSEYRGVKYFANVPCICNNCIKSEAPSLFPYPKLLDWAKTKQKVVCNESSSSITINRLIFNAGLENFSPKIILDDFEFEDKNMRKTISRNRNRNINTVGHVITINKTPQTSFPSESPKVESEIEKELKAIKKKEEESEVKKWKNKALITFIFCFSITFLGLYFYHYQIGNFDWKRIKNGDLSKWIGSGVIIILNGFPLKMMYDRFLDSTKEKGFRENLKNK